MLVFDLDGTLLCRDGLVSDRTKEYLIEKKMNGYKIVIATGRVRKSAISVTKGGEFVDIFINDNGTSIYDNNLKEELFVKHLPKHFVSSMMDLYDKKIFNFIDVCDKDYIYKLTENEEENPIIKNKKDKMDIIQEVGDVLHIGLVLYDNNDVEKLYAKLVSLYPDLEILLMQDSFASRKWIEIQPQGCTKTNAIKWLAKYLGIDDADIMTFGDGLNDVEMLKNCGVGVAMANALEEVKNVADLVTEKTNEDDGIVEFLEKY